MEGDARQIASAADDSANSRSLFVLWRFSREVVGAAGFEPAAPCAQGRCATRLRYAPTPEASIVLPILHAAPFARRPSSRANCRRPARIPVNLQHVGQDVESADPARELA